MKNCTAKYGGWPENLETDDKYLHVLPKSYLNAVVKDSETGIYILPITALKP